MGRRTTAEAQVQTSLREKEVLLWEIHYRVKNNLQFVSSLLNRQLRVADDPHLQVLMQDCRLRIQAMALIHDALYQAGVGVPPALDWGHTTILGLKLIAMLTEHLSGNLRLDREGAPPSPSRSLSTEIGRMQVMRVAWEG